MSFPGWYDSGRKGTLMAAFSRTLLGSEQLRVGGRWFRTTVATAALAVFGCVLVSSSNATDQLSYLYVQHEHDPYYVGTDFPKLTTPQWVGEPGVEAVVILSIDDMRDPERYEQFLRPILSRLQQLDGRAPVSIFTNSVDPRDERLATWLEEGLSLEVHTIDHPCPLLKDGDFAKARSTYDRCVDLMATVPASQPVAFRMPCCDSLNTPSPRFYAEIFARETGKGNSLAIDSSVFNVFTPADASLPKEITTNGEGRSRFRHYLPFPSFVNTIENYPYPYVIGERCWQFPCVVPSDWEGQNVHEPNNPATLRDLKYALDATVIKQGVMPIVFHPHGWIRNEQLVQFIDYAAKKYGSKVKFLNFREASERINEHLLLGRTLRSEGDPSRLIDVNRDGFMDVVQSNRVRVWDPRQRRFEESALPTGLETSFALLRSGTIHLSGLAPDGLVFYRYEDAKWQRVPCGIRMSALSDAWRDRLKRPGSIDVRWHDLDSDGNSELLLTSEGETILLAASAQDYVPLSFGLPAGLRLLNADGGDSGVRFRDLNGDGGEDLISSTEQGYAVYAFVNQRQGWKLVRSGEYGAKDGVPAIVRADGSNNGAWFHSSHLWVQNEYTNRMSDLVDRVSFTDLLRSQPNVDSDDPFGAAKTVEESLATFNLLPGFRIEVAAAEPQIVDPVAFDWGTDGRLWVAEMRDYPNGIEWHGPGDPLGVPGGRVKVLEDRDRDGRYETAQLFLDDLAFPNTVKAWRKGVLVAAGGEVIYAEDSNGDGQADIRRVLFRGFGNGNQQHRVNGLRWGLDHWVHLANGDSGGTVTSLATGEEVVIRGRDLRVRPDDGGMELTSGQTQFGRSRDNDGNWFGGNNSNPIWHYALEERYLRRNSGYAAPPALTQISRVPGAAPVYPSSRTAERFNDFDRADRFTSACSPEIFRGPPDEQGRIFAYVCEPVHNLVHRSVIRPRGVTFEAYRDEQEQQREFLTSSEHWFRPVMVRSGPDSAIWIADMYRKVIEHPEWIPMKWQRRLDHLAGGDAGRIYRVVREPVDHPAEWEAIASMEPVELVALLADENGIVRDLAQQELYWREDASSVDLLKPLLEDPYGVGLVPAMYLLESLDELTNVELQSVLAFATRSPTATRHALRLAEPRLADSEAVANVVIQLGQALVNEAPTPLKQQLAYTLGFVRDERAAELLARIGRQDVSDPLMMAAVMSSITADNVGDVLPAVHKLTSQEGQGGLFFHNLMASAIGYRRPAAVETALELASEWDIGPRLDLLAHVVASARKRDVRLDALLSEQGRDALRRYSQRAMRLVVDSETNDATRMVAVQILGRDGAASAEVRDALLGLIVPTSATSLQVAAVNRLDELQDDSGIQRVLERWRELSPIVRAKVLDVAIRKERWARLVIDQVKDGNILPVQISSSHQQTLLRHSKQSLRDDSAKVFVTPESDRQRVVEAYQSVGDLTADAASGRAVFKKQCSACHRLGGEGKAIGPDLMALSDSSLPAMLTAILDPNRAIEDKYLNYSLLTQQGTQFNGLLLRENATAVTLATPNGEEQTVLRSRIASLIDTGVSLMPEGLEKVMSKQEMADLIGFVQSAKRQLRRKSFPGNEPQVAPVRNDGSIRLFAIHAEIYGPSVQFEEKYRNLGFWSSDQDRAIWTVEPVKAGAYEVIVRYACAPQPGVSRLRLSVHGQKLTQDIEDTGSWDNYRSVNLGTIELPADKVRVAIDSEGPVAGFLMDLQTIFLYPE